MPQTVSLRHATCETGGSHRKRADRTPLRSAQFHHAIVPGCPAQSGATSERGRPALVAAPIDYANNPPPAPAPVKRQPPKPHPSLQIQVPTTAPESYPVNAPPVHPERPVAVTLIAETCPLNAPPVHPERPVAVTLIAETCPLNAPPVHLDLSRVECQYTTKTCRVLTPVLLPCEFDSRYLQMTATPGRNPARRIPPHSKDAGGKDENPPPLPTS